MNAAKKPKAPRKDLTKAALAAVSAVLLWASVGVAEGAREPIEDLAGDTVATLFFSEKEDEQLEEDNEKLEDEIRQLQNENEKLEDAVLRLQEEKVALLTERIASLERRVAGQDTVESP